MRVTLKEHRGWLHLLVQFYCLGSFAKEPYKKHFMAIWMLLERALLWLLLCSTRGLQNPFVRASLLLCKKALQTQGSFARETCHFQEPTNRCKSPSQPAPSEEVPYFQHVYSDVCCSMCCSTCCITSCGALQCVAASSQTFSGLRLA